MQGLKWIHSYTRHLVVLGLAILASLVIPQALPAQAESSCSLQEYTLPSTSYLQLTHTSGYVVHLQRSSSNYAPTVKLWEQQQYSGEYPIPVDVYDIQVRLEGRWVLETWMGQVRQVYKQVPVARACAESWTGLLPW